jgi:type I restriction enzyme S subunit
MPIPPLLIQQKIATLVILESRMRKTVTTLEGALREYRMRLISDVITGKANVREVAAILPDEIVQEEILDETDPFTGDSLDDDSLSLEPDVDDEVEA